MIAIQSVTKRYGTVLALQGATFEVSLKQIVGVVGPSGCGKTTLLRLIAGLECPDEGKVSIDGVEVSTPTHMSPPHTRKLSLIFQDLALWPHMSVREHLEFVLKKAIASKSDRQTRISLLLEKVSMNGYQGRYPHQLSGGERQRLAVARAIASNPVYLLMDEPFSNIDSLLREELQELVLRLRDELRMGILYVTHNIEEALALADRLAVMRKGRIEQSGTIEEIIGNARTDFVKRFLRI